MTPRRPWDNPEAAKELEAKDDGHWFGSVGKCPSLELK